MKKILYSKTIELTEKVSDLNNNLSDINTKVSDIQTAVSSIESGMGQSDQIYLKLEQDFNLYKKEIALQLQSTKESQDRISKALDDIRGSVKSQTEQNNKVHETLSKYMYDMAKSERQRMWSIVVFVIITVIGAALNYFGLTK